MNDMDPMAEARREISAMRARLADVEARAAAMVAAPLTDPPKPKPAMNDLIRQAAGRGVADPAEPRPPRLTGAALDSAINAALRGTRRGRTVTPRLSSESAAMDRIIRRQPEPTDEGASS